MAGQRDLAGVLRWGIVVAIILFVLTLLEWYVAGHFTAIMLLVLLAILKAALIIKEYMHIGLLLGDEGEAH
jgi:hypothetical protein